jgi:hypothetical protein
MTVRTMAPSLPNRQPKMPIETEQGLEMAAALGGGIVLEHQGGRQFDAAGHQRGRMAFVSRMLKEPWFAVAIWVAVIYTTIPFVRRLREAFVARLPAELIGFAVMAVVGLAAAAALLVLARSPRRLRPADALWLLAVAGAVLLWTRNLMGQPEEAVHFLEYGALGVLTYRALRVRTADATVFFTAALLGVLVGTVDEIIQWVTPGRYWDVRDIVLNGGASVLVQVAVWRLVPRPPSATSTRSVRLLCRLAAAEILLLTVCFAATPQRLQRLADHAPALQELARGDDVIAEYGFMHEIDQRTRFRSRLTRDELAAEDRARSFEVAAALRDSRGADNVVLRPVDSASDPFTAEVRVHLFSRNRNLGEARRAAADPDQRRQHLTAAFREQLILENAFGRTLDQSNSGWPQKLRDRVEAGQDVEARYVSPVGAHLITRIGETALRVLMLSLLVAALGCDLLAGRLSATPRDPSPAERKGRNRRRTGPETRG